MSKKKVYITVGIIFILALFAGILDYPKYFNQGVDFLNNKLALGLSHFWEKPFRLGLDLQGGTHLVYEADLSNVKKEDYDSSMQGLRDVIERRVNLFGVEEPTVQVQEAADSYRLIVELAGIKNSAEAIEMIGETPFLEFKEQRSEEETQMILDKQKEVEGMSLEEAQQIENWELALEDPYFKSTSLTGKYLENAELGFDQTTYQPLVLIQFDDEGSGIFADLTASNIGKPLAIYIDGLPISVPTVQEIISGGKAQISGKFTLEEAKTLARNLSAGALPVPINLISQQSVGPTLGAISLQESLKAGAAGLLLVILFLIVFYRIPGLLASLALFIYVAFMLALFKLIPVTLTLAGIGGFILSIGMAIDANILIFSRMREELKEGRSFGSSVEEAFRRAWPAIRDGNFTTLIVALILFGFGTSFVKGFAFTLSVGILMSILSAVFVTKNFLRVFIGLKTEKVKWLWK
ncbi:MAG: protein translocase subunit SecD [Candidatus Nealsonbacteria bacterium]